MKLALCILAFDNGISNSKNPEDRVLAAQYLTALAPLLARVVSNKEIKTGIDYIDRLFGQTWIVDLEPFKNAFDLWIEAKSELQSIQTE